MSDTQAKTALLVMDMQEGIVAAYAQNSPILTTTRAAIDAAHAASIPVIYVVVGFRPGYPEVSSRNKTFSGVAARVRVSGVVPSMEVHHAIAPQPTDIMVTKHRVSGFSGSDLEMILRSQNITHLVLSGIATSGVVLSTLREAADKDYQLTVLADCCLDNDEEVHRVLLTKVFPRQADVVQGAEWIAQIASPAL